MKKHIAILIAVIFAVTQLLTGCSKGKNNEKDKKEKGTIRFATFYSSKEQGALYKKIVKEYEKQNEGVKIDLITDFGDDENIKESLSEKGDIDILGLRRDQVIEYARSGFITDISDFVEEKDLNRKLYKISIAYGKYNGKTYGIGDMPIAMEWFYNTDIFNKYGLTEPKDLKELKSVCSKLKSKKVTPIGIGSLDGWNLMMMFGMITAQTSGVSEFNSKYGSDGDAFKDIKGIKDAFSIYGDIMKNCVPSNSSEINYRQSVDDFVKGKCAILPAMSNTMDIIEKSKPSAFRYGVFETPVKFIEQPVSNISASGGQVLVIPSNTKNKKEAYKFLEFLFSEDTQKIITENGYTSSLIMANSSENKVKSNIFSHLEMTDDNSIMLIDNLNPDMSEITGRVLQEIQEGRLKSSEGWKRVLKFTFK